MVFGGRPGPGQGTNPPAGAVIDYYLKAAPPEAEAKQVKLEILSADGKVIQTFQGKPAEGGKDGKDNKGGKDKEKKDQPAKAQKAQAEAQAGRGWYAGLARTGLVAKGVSYGIVGVLAIKLAVGAGGKAASRAGALHTLAGQAGHPCTRETRASSFGACGRCPRDHAGTRGGLPTWRSPVGPAGDRRPAPHPRGPDRHGGSKQSHLFSPQAASPPKHRYLVSR